MARNLLILTIFLTLTAGHALAQDTFQREVIGTELGPTYRLTSGDVNDDGLVDIVTATTDGYLTLWLQDGSGAFTETRLFGTNRAFFQPAIGDLDGDGDLDLAAISRAAGELWWWERQGDGYTASLISGSISQPYALLAADLSGDGLTSLIAASSADGQVRTFEFSPDGFTMDTLGVADDVRALILADLNNDGRPDIVSAPHGSDQIRAFVARVDDGYDAVDLGPSLSGPWDVAAADLDGDGDLDLAALGSSALVWLRQDDPETWTRLDLATFTVPGRLDVGDVDGDGTPDIVASTFFPAALHVHRNDGSGSFTAEALAPVPEQPGATRCVDLDGDGTAEPILTDLDELTLSLWRHRVYPFAPGFVSNPLPTLPHDVREICGADMDGDGDGDIIVLDRPNAYDFETRWAETTEDGVAQVLHVIDDDSDIWRDAYFPDLEGDLLTDIVAWESYGPTVMQQRADGSFDHLWIGGTDYGYTGVGVGDLDRDGDVDMLTTEYQSYSGSLYFHRYEPPDWQSLYMFSTASSYQAIAIHDFDGDHRVDALLCGPYATRMFWQTAAGWEDEFSDDADFRGRLVVGDVDSDGDPDVMGSSPLNVRWMENRGRNQEFVLHIPADVPNTDSWSAGDWDGDGLLDFVQVNDGVLTPEVVVYHNWAGTFIPHTAATGHFHDVDWVDIDRDGDLDILAHGGEYQDPVWIETVLDPPIAGPVLIHVVPDDPPIQLPYWGGPFTLTITLRNLLDEPVSGALQGFAVTPALVERPLPTVPFTLAAHEVRVLSGVQQSVPVMAPHGLYELHIEATAGDSLSDRQLVNVTKDEAWAAGVDDPSARPGDVTLSAAYPNPCNARSSITLTLPRSGRVELTLHDVTGRRIGRQSPGSLPPGSHALTLDLSDVASGLVFVRATVDGALVGTQKLVVLR